ncbi:glucokinase [Rhodoplanes roseus]|uniref:Glucokinase n=1 Tax=Rhodoplanes roseus TaxID=29409 RepID=A0A327L0V8_9BRAD|nr:glucokinase [Rhodoplanes roseus]RAI43152.1 glucokinase [Rhodoplanes roseus]
MSAAVLLADIGGTNARFALMTDRLGAIRHLKVSEYPGPKDAMATVLRAEGPGLRLAGAVLAVAAPVEGDSCRFTNSPWVVDAAELRAAFGIPQVVLVNDFEAVGWSLASLAPGDLLAVGAGAAVPHGPMVVLGPGTGLGVAALVPGPGGSVVVPTEGGHATLAVTTDREAAVVALLRRRYGHVSAERALSGPGIEALHAAIAAVDGVLVPARRAAEITQLAEEGTCPVCRAAVDMFCAMLGSVAGDLALIFRARGGVFVAGGIVPRLGQRFASSEFRARFEAKGRFEPYLAAIPTSVIVHPDVAFVGLQAIAARLRA